MKYRNDHINKAIARKGIYPYLGSYLLETSANEDLWANPFPHKLDRRASSGI